MNGVRGAPPATEARGARRSEAGRARRPTEALPAVERSEAPRKALRERLPSRSRTPAGAPPADPAPGSGPRAPAAASAFPELRASGPAAPATLRAPAQPERPAAGPARRPKPAGTGGTGRVGVEREGRLAVGRKGHRPHPHPHPHPGRGRFLRSRHFLPASPPSCVQRRAWTGGPSAAAPVGGKRGGDAGRRWLGEG